LRGSRRCKFLDHVTIEIKWPATDTSGSQISSLTGKNAFQPKDYFFDLFARFGNPLRFVLAIFFNSVVLIDFSICFDAPRSQLFDFFPRFAASAAPAAICCFLDFAGIQT
jgi:hypothetical protein